MGSLRDKNLLFYSIHPKDDDSRDFMTELDKNPLLKKQFILICVNDPNIKIPDKIRQMNKVPVLVAAGFSRPILGQDAVTWLKNGAQQEKGNGFDYGSLSDSDSSKFAFITDDLKPSDYNQFYNSDYNHGFSEKDSILNQQFSKLNDAAHITTYDDANELKKDISGQLEQRLSQLRQQRDTDTPRAVKRIGGLEDQQGSQGSQSQGQNFMSGNRPGNGEGLAYNPNPFGNHNQQGGGGGGQNGAPQLPFNMPMQQQQQMPMQPQQQMQQQQHQQQMQPMQPYGRPGLPFNMPGMPQQQQQQPQLPFNMPLAQMGGQIR